MRKIVTAVALLSMLFGARMAAGAQEEDHSHAHSGPVAPLAAATEYAQGEVRNINKDTGRITVRHGPIPSLEMPAMTMVFRVKDPKLLEGVKVGDKVQFAAERANGAITIVDLKPAR